MNHLNLISVSDDTLLQRFSNVVSKERAATADVIAYLAEIDLRKLYAKLGFAAGRF